MPNSRPMTAAIGPGCHELRVRDKSHNWRIFYHVDADASVILGVFAKTIRQTPKAGLDACQRRLAAYQQAMKKPKKQ